MERVTQKMLENKADTINDLLGTPKTPWTQTSDGLKSNIGNYHISYAYGGACLHQISNEGGAVRTPLSYGHIKKRELFDQMTAFIAGIQEGKKITSEPSKVG